ncbi:MAG: NAD(P)-dependent glycerol-3-phosphate dehydrogenase [Rhodobiaceae bacterium]|nr:NAD(P)-dependent glycerol-3-phosphate dehydrogenase [Rhodobiaceae bacterium]MCC0012528.1 NAD(P)-dependent glycerol-3-phosphate dehydrogenase [Rhodobiaceae bacterium]MCC0052408.1 NAD(P)-dependent glycerol-3-phosphate dehydrogenase [Rhodobiaceae bacterium]MCC0061735.1 NAD(P)-dependent glycerol-3-phosphate dehydrogenase [Rhodobiaceae bacterium]
MSRIGIIGAGAWGTALATVARRAGADVVIWGRNTQAVDAINTGHENPARLPGIALDSEIRATANPADIAGSTALLLAAPAQHLRNVCGLFAAHVRDGTPAIICAKGIERETGMMMSDVVTQALPQARVAVLSGPSFAADVARGLPTAVTLACGDEVLGTELVETIGTASFRPYFTDDIMGVEIGGAAKNVLAIASGIVAGKGLGASAGAALTTRGFAELARLGLALGARPETLSGLSGLGDLILTCGSLQSRNMAFGHALGSGKTMREASSATNAVSEGIWTAKALVRVADKLGVEMPIAHAVDDVLSQRMSVEDAIRSLLARPFRSERG